MRLKDMTRLSWSDSTEIYGETRAEHEENHAPVCPKCGLYIYAPHALYDGDHFHESCFQLYCIDAGIDYDTAERESEWVD